MTVSGYGDWGAESGFRRCDVGKTKISIRVIGGCNEKGNHERTVDFSTKRKQSERDEEK